METSWALSIHLVSYGLASCAPASGSHLEALCEWLLLRRTLWEPFPSFPELPCQTRVCGSHFKGIGYCFGATCAPQCSQTVQNFKERNRIYFLHLYKLPVMLGMYRSLMTVKYREPGARIPQCWPLWGCSAILWCSRNTVDTIPTSLLHWPYRPKRTTS